MASKVEVPMITQNEKKDFLHDIQQKHKDLGRRQREYKKVLSMRFKTRYQRILENSHIKTINTLKTERNDLRAQIWVAHGHWHVSDDQRNLEQIQCQIKCQERLAKEIKELKVRIGNMEREIGRGDKQIYELNRRTVPDTQHQTHVASARKKLHILENRLEVGIRRECSFTASNAALREELKTLLGHRAYFHNLYTKLVQQLNTEKKYLLDLLDYASSAYEGTIDVNEKIMNVKRKFSKDFEQAKLEMQSIMRKYAATELVYDFMNCKNQTRHLADLQPFEYHRRENFKRQHLHTIGLYNNVLSKIYEYTNSYNIEAVIEKYQQHESFYYSYFSLENELSYHISLLETAVDRLFNSVIRTKAQNWTHFNDQKSEIGNLEFKLFECRKRNEELNIKYMGAQKNLEHHFHVIASIFNLCLADATPLMKFLGDQTFINLHNVHKFLMTLEKRILDLIRNIFVMEREDGTKTNNDYVVRECEKIREEPTDLNDIVLTQQCPECAEGEIFNIDANGDNTVAVLSIKDTQAALFEKVNQPEMQYHLHSISQCRLPRSRLLAAKRYI